MKPGIYGKPQIQINDAERMDLIYFILNEKLGGVYRTAKGLRMVTSLEKKTTEQLKAEVEKLRNKKMIESTNHDWGFYGTTQRNYEFSPEIMPHIFDAVAIILVKHTKLPEAQIQHFLDGRYGRHLSDELSFHGAKSGIGPLLFFSALRKFLKSDRAEWFCNEVRNEAYK